ncbi:di/tricarboxylate transporter [Arthrobacter sp. CAN_A214]
MVDDRSRATGRHRAPAAGAVPRVRRGTDRRRRPALRECGDGTRPPKNFSIAYAASIGSLGTIIGTPPNALMVGYLAENHDITVGYGQWMLVGGPMSVVFMAIAWFLLTSVIHKPEMDEVPGGRQLIRSDYKKLGSMSAGEKQVLVVFVLAAWVFSLTY